MHVENDENIYCEVKKGMEKMYHPMVPELVQTFSFYFPTYEEFMATNIDKKDNYIYTRDTNPATEILEKKIARLERGKKCKVFASGMGAISATLFTLLQQGDHVSMVSTIYEEPVSFVQYLGKFGISLAKVDITETEELFQFVQENTKVIYFKSPSSQKFELLGLERMTALAQKIGTYTVISSTWASPLPQHPLCHNVDLMVHSYSRYVGGHSDIVAGTVIGEAALVNQIFEHGHRTLGAVNSPFNSWLALRGIRTMSIRLAHQSQAIQTVLSTLQKDPRISRLYHPFVGNQQQQALAEKYLAGYSSLFAIDLEDTDFERLKIFVNALTLVTIGVSQNGFESLALPIFKSNNLATVQKRGLSPAHIRTYVSLEEPTSIVENIQQALDQTYGGESLL